LRIQPVSRRIPPFNGEIDGSDEHTSSIVFELSCKIFCANLRTGRDLCERSSVTLAKGIVYNTMDTLVTFVSVFGTSLLEGLFFEETGGAFPSP